MTRVGYSKCSVALVPSNIYGIDYALNPYVGCLHGCVYCYARRAFLRRGIGHLWGKYVEVKKGFVERLKKDLRRARQGARVMISTYTDGWQPVEGEVRLTRACLEALKARPDLRVEVLTKSAAVLRDLDLLSELRASVGLTVITLDEGVQRVLEPKAAPPSARFSAMRKAAEAGLEAWLFLGPVLPLLTDRPDDVKRLIKEAAAAGASYVIFDRLNLRMGVLSNLVRALGEEYPEVARAYAKWDRAAMERRVVRAAAAARSEAARLGLRFELAYD